MKRNTGPDHTLESLKIFPYVAWGLIIGFGLFVYGITNNLRAAAEDLQAQTELSLNAPIVKKPRTPSPTSTAPIR